jgi:hypothetical protein
MKFRKDRPSRLLKGRGEKLYVSRLRERDAG